MWPLVGVNIPKEALAPNQCGTKHSLPPNLGYCNLSSLGMQRPHSIGPTTSGVRGGRAHPAHHLDWGGALIPFVTTRPDLANHGPSFGLNT